MWFADRGGRVALLDGDLPLKDLKLEGIMALSAAPDGSALSLLARGDKLLRLDARGNPLWSTELRPGSFSAPPAESGGRIAVVSDLGLVSLFDAARGEALWSWQASAGGLVLAAPLVGEDGTVFVAALDGSLSAARAR